MGMNVKVEEKPKEGVPSPKRKKEAAFFIIKEKETEQSQHQDKSADHQVQHIEPANVIRRTEKQAGNEAPAKLLTEKILHEDTIDEIARTGEDAKECHEI